MKEAHANENVAMTDTQLTLFKAGVSRPIKNYNFAINMIREILFKFILQV